MKYYKVVMSKGDPIYLAEDKLEKLNAAETQLIHAQDSKGNEVFINKAHIVQMQHDPKIQGKVEDIELQKRIERTKASIHGGNDDKH